jgi:hypothetical protein
VEAEFTVISSEAVQVALHDVGSMSAARLGPELTGLDLFPVISFNIKHVYVVHPVDSIIPAKVINLAVN